MMRIKQFVQKAVSSRVRDSFFWRVRAPIILLELYCKEAWLHIQHSFWLPANSVSRLRIRMVMYSHVIEKGLAMPKPRPFFGQGVVRQVIRDLQTALLMEQFPEFIKTLSYKVLDSYVIFHKGKEGGSADQAFVNEVQVFLESYQIELVDNIVGGAQTIKRDDLLDFAKGDFLSLVSNRRSIRNFSKEPVSKETIKNAVKIAQMSPSACNLQPSHVYVVKDKSLVQKVLELQAGARGFSEVVDTLFIITCDFSLGIGPRTRNQGFVDNGLFAMNLMNGLLYYGVGSCPMHWSVNADAERALRKIISIEKSHRVSMLIVAGNLPNVVNTPISQRVSMDSILHFDSPE